MTTVDALSLKYLSDRMRPLAGQIVLLYGTELARLHGVAQDEMDLYYITETRAKGLAWSSAVGGVVGIRDRLGEDYDRIDESFSLNGIPAGPWQVVSEIGLRRYWIEGTNPNADVGVGEQMAMAAARQLDDIDRMVGLRTRLRADDLVRDVLAHLEANGLDQARLDQIRDEVRHSFARAPQCAGIGPAERLNAAILHRTGLMAGISHADISEQWGAILTALRKAGLLHDHPGVLELAPEDGTRKARSEFAFIETQQFMRSICFDVRHGAPTAGQASGVRRQGVPDEDHSIWAELHAAVPALESLLMIWLRANPALLDLLALRPDMPDWWPAACFCMSEFRIYDAVPGRLGLSADEAVRVRQDLHAAGIRKPD